MPSAIPRQIIDLNQASQALVTQQQPLLLQAQKHWNDSDLFDDDQVMAVKEIFGTVFETQEVLRGYTLQDALVLSPSTDRDILYVMVLERDLEATQDPSLTWVKAVLSTKNMGFSKDITFDTLLLFASASNYNAEDERVGGDETKIFLSDFFDYWRRHFSRERIHRVTTRGMTSEARQQRIIRGPSVLPRMRWEARMLGFQDYTAENPEDSGSIDLDWVDEEALERGYAPQMFTVSFDSGEDMGYAKDKGIVYEDCDNQEIKVEFGVYVEESYGPYPEFLKTWADWDNYLINVAAPLGACDQSKLQSRLALLLQNNFSPELIEPIVDHMFVVFKDDIKLLWRHTEIDYYLSLCRLAFKMEADLIEMAVSTGMSLC